MKKRPNGDVLYFLSLASIVIGVFLILYAGSARNLQSPLLVWIGYSMLGLSVPFGIGGAIIRAIWFLPGEEQKPG